MSIRRNCGTLLVVLSACDARKQAPAAPRAVLASDSLVARIDRTVRTLRRDTATVLELSAEGATLDAAYRDTTLQRLRVVYLGETGRVTDTFYFDSSLFFLVRGEVRYDAPLSGRVADSVTRRFDLRSDSTTAGMRDSLRAEVRSLLDNLASASRR